MASRKCHVCGTKSSSRWFNVSGEKVEDVKRCFNVHRDVENCLCASCMRNLTRWRKSGKFEAKYFAKANSRGKPSVNKSILAKENRRVSIAKSSKMSEGPASLLCIPEDLLLNTVLFLGISDISSVRRTCKYFNSLCASNYLWKNLMRRDFPDCIHLLDGTDISQSFLSYKVIHSVTLSSERVQFRERVRTQELVKQFREEERKLVSQNEDIQQRLGTVQLKLLKLQTDQDPSSPVTKLQDQVIIND